MRSRAPTAPAWPIHAVEVPPFPPPLGIPAGRRVAWYRVDRHRTRVAYVRALFVGLALEGVMVYDHEGILYDSTSPLALAVIACWRAWRENQQAEGSQQKAGGG